MLSKKYPGNPFSPDRRKGCLVWSSLLKVKASQVQQVCEIQGELGRSTLINTGGHGSLKGSDPTEAKLGEGKFIVEDMNIAINSKGSVGLHIVSPGAKAKYPENIDIIISWCYGK